MLILRSGKRWKSSNRVNAMDVLELRLFERRTAGGLWCLWSVVIALQQYGLRWPVNATHQTPRFFQCLRYGDRDCVCTKSHSDTNLLEKSRAISNPNHATMSNNKSFDANSKSLCHFDYDETDYADSLIVGPNRNRYDLSDSSREEMSA